ncbi:MAG: hypothetical protein V1801_01555 [Candidatus Falkowbacteria bacterium]
MKKMGKFFVVMAIVLAVTGFNINAMAEMLTEKQMKAIQMHLNSPEYTLWLSYLAVRLQKGEETLIVYAAPYLMTDGKKLDNSEIKRFEIV